MASIAVQLVLGLLGYATSLVLAFALLAIFGSDDPSVSELVPCIGATSLLFGFALRWWWLPILPLVHFAFVDPLLENSYEPPWEVSGGVGLLTAGTLGTVLGVILGRALRRRRTQSQSSS